MKPVLLAFAIVLAIGTASSYILEPGPVVKATVGELWPKPKSQTSSPSYFILKRSSFQLKVTNRTCDILEKAIERYQKLILSVGSDERRSSAEVSKKSWRSDPNFIGNLEEVKVNLKAPCEQLPYLGMDESYELVIDETRASIDSFSIWGMLRGLESFSQLVVGNMLRVNTTTISDSPRFSHRGLLVDTSRHFISMNILMTILDGMAYNKLNVFHWHIVDDHAFPYQSTVYPELSAQGAYRPTMVYTPEDVQKVIEEARLRGIRVMSEFDTPGHTRSWGISHPELLTPCFDQYAGKFGPIDPTKESTYTFLYNLFQEVVGVFPDQYIHLGGDEVGFECWASNPDIMEYMKENRLYTFEMLEEQYIQRVVDQIDSLNRSSLVWQEVYVNGVRLPNGTVVHVWTGNRQDLLQRITGDGLPALLSTCWYLDHLAMGGDWRKFYECDPHDFVGNQKQKDLVLGGEACMWAEAVNDNNIVQRIFPRVSAVAEKLWSEEDVDDADEAARRLEEHTCRMNQRNIPAQPPNGPGFC
ncbi:beta-hexosaminidase subunit beta-like [Toxorhynchites rutilus septentrionalis]|uniref:beta-hexosaminidase subunit beta-like n=1 Tax=Toxorhynchites rutilus septentrionalis TaxID=329112 RepID=UPI002479C527|nr:beta-hexosaminidase subunit beta-like [Toxorhynchites rutilus septentrionalis]